MEIQEQQAKQGQAAWHWRWTVDQCLEESQQQTLGIFSKVFPKECHTYCPLGLLLCVCPLLFLLKTDFFSVYSVSFLYLMVFF